VDAGGLEGPTRNVGLTVTSVRVLQYPPWLENSLGGLTSIALLTDDRFSGYSLRSTNDRDVSPIQNSRRPRLVKIHRPDRHHQRQQPCLALRPRAHPIFRRAHTGAGTRCAAARTHSPGDLAPPIDCRWPFETAREREPPWGDEAGIGDVSARGATRGHAKDNWGCRDRHGCGWVGERGGGVAGCQRGLELGAQECGLIPSTDDVGVVILCILFVSSSWLTGACGRRPPIHLLCYHGSPTLRLTLSCSRAFPTHFCS